MIHGKPGTPLPFDQCENFRELGGYRGFGGKSVRYGVFFRSPALSGIRTPEDIARFRSLGIRKVFDFRSAIERTADPDPQLAEEENIGICAMLDENKNEVNFDMEKVLESEKNLASMMEKVSRGYYNLPFDNSAYKAMFSAIRAGDTPLLFHCTAGKDRTGVAAALILKMLGVSDADIMDDYLKTNEYRGCGTESLRQMFAGAGYPDALALRAAQTVAGVDAQNLQNSMDAISARYPSFEAYLAAEYGIGKEELHRIRQKYLVSF